TGIYRKYIDRYLEGDIPCRVDDEDLKDLNEIYTRSGNCRGYYHARNGREMISIDRPSYKMADDCKLEELYLKHASGSIKAKAACRMEAHEGRPFTLSLTGSGIRVDIEGSLVEAALNKPTDPDNIRKHLNKTNDSFFEFEEIVIEADDNIFIPVSALNNARREGLLQLADELLKSHRRDMSDRAELSEKKTAEDVGERQTVNVRIDRYDMLEYVIGYDLCDIISIDINAFGNDKRLIDEVSEKIKSTGKRFFIALPAVVRNGYFERNEGFMKAILMTADGIMVDNLESLYYLRNAGYGGCIVSDIHLYAANDHAIDMLKDNGVSVITYPVELNRRELGKLKPFDGEFILYGYYPMMISAQCTEKTMNGCKKDNGISHIKDRYGNDFVIVRNCNECFNTIYNCVPMMASPDEVMRGSLKGISFRLHFTFEEKDEIINVMDCYRKAFNGEDVPLPDIKRTLGHLKRGVE
ncbi:MAG: DUF3656 domain-containing protein, partial [Lachnospiraceae bacterium]|nr:DUF3656 domain-containing protein [Lachnospiraceae bacterium]